MHSQFGHAQGIAASTHTDPHQFDEQLPANGWELSLARNQFLGEIVGQIPRSAVIYTPDQTNARSDKEWHLIVHKISDILDENIKKLGLKLGDRVIISGQAIQTFFNGMEFQIVPFNAIQAVLRHKDCQWVGSKYGSRAMIDGKPDESGKEPAAAVRA